MDVTRWNDAVQTITSKDWLTLPEETRKATVEVIEGARFTMAELIDQVGITTPRTVHWYIEKGLLPEAERVGKNRHLYDARHVALMRIVNHLKMHMPLGWVTTLCRRILESGVSAADLVRVHTLLGDAYPEEPDFTPASIEETLCSWLGWNFRDRTNLLTGYDPQLLALAHLFEAWIGACLIAYAVDSQGDLGRPEGRSSKRNTAAKGGI